ncbi:unnamed protein product [Didymodactylos carnosus]|uniref:EF-hand domain-containing protein n=1 Tax=Didymodactylos carnosus TaxID=1234261 RepID=A0A815SYF2_9BILA|nr:unnamed protein product [Didymodactylos carnosus]CAF1497027.1 unnamed protein product [Didymodactylos carnosus]CAF3780276.1 unnamed protein product [Didymodactylos carnosus]CAF4359296.1 unnamed protein product [Didymodactylos carnosus]
MDNSGFIDKAEMRRILESIYDLTGESKTGINSPEKKVDQIFSKMDLNSDHKLSKTEFINGCLQDAYLYALLAPTA